MTPRKTMELKILQSLDDKPTLEAVLNEAWTSGLFTKEEMDIIVKDTAVYETTAAVNTTKIDNVTALCKKLGATKAFVLTNLIKQFPQGRSTEDGYFKPNKKAILTNCLINESQLAVILNDLRQEGYIERKINKGLHMFRLNWSKLS